MHLVEEEALAPERPGSSARAFVKALARTPDLVDRSSLLASGVVSALAGLACIVALTLPKRLALGPAMPATPSSPAFLRRAWATGWAGQRRPIVAWPRSKRTA